MPVESRDDLVKRLQAAHAGSTQRVFGSNIFEDAATRIESDAKRIAELEAERDWLVSSGHKQGAQIADSVVVEIADAVAEERERCARIAEEAFNTSGWNTFMRSAGNSIATAIRSGKPDGKE